MPRYHQLHLVPDGRKGRAPVEPDFAPLIAQRVRLRDDFLRGFLADPDARVHGINTQLPGLGHVLLQVYPVEHTAALATFAKVMPAPAAPRLLIAAAMLGGFDAADEAAYERMKTTSGFSNNKDLPVQVVVDAARRGRRPLMVQCFEYVEFFEHALLRTMCDALGDAFFAQFGDASLKRDDPPSDLPHDQWIDP